ncbi:MAG: class F sortase [Nocardioidaceae bacterium]|nr:class F sortase [Nocardioidaceae bacterium]
MRYVAALVVSTGACLLAAAALWPSAAGPAALRPGETVRPEVLYRTTGSPRAPRLAPVRTQQREAGPDRITIPALGAALPVVPAPVRHGRMQVPGGVTRVGWLTTSAGPDAAHGVSVYATHRDTGGGGRGLLSPFAGIERLRPGATLTVTWHGRDHRYRVVRVQHVGADALPASMMRRTGPRQLVLVTCGGRLRVGQDHRLQWTERILLWAERTP